jgi:hypothetical protein
MRRYTRDYCKEMYKSVPCCIKYLAGAEKTTATIGAITNSHEVDHDSFMDEICYVYYGIEKAGDFKKNLKLFLNLSEEEVNAITNDVNELIFLPMLDMLVHGKGRTERIYPETSECNHCGGSGAMKCEDCNGEGYC